MQGGYTIQLRNQDIKQFNTKRLNYIIARIYGPEYNQLPYISWNSPIFLYLKRFGD